MPRSYDCEYNGELSDYKRKRRSIEESENGANNLGGNLDKNISLGHRHEVVVLNEKTSQYLQECIQEQKAVEKKYSICKRILDFEIEKVLVSGRIPKPETYANIYSEKPIRIAQKVLFPVKEYPKFNFVGKILGPKGNTLRQLQEKTFCKMVIMGRNSMRDHVKEEELRNSGDPKYAHLSRDLHVEISTVASPSEAYQRLAYALAEIRKYMIPDFNDEIRLEQIREIDGNDKMYKKSYYAKQYNHTSYSRTPPPPVFNKSSKPEIYTILEKTRYAMEDPEFAILKQDRHRDPEIYAQANEFDRYSTPAPPPPSKHSGGHRHGAYEGTDSFERDYRREYHTHSSYYANTYTEKPSNCRSSSSHRPASSGSHTTSYFDSASRSCESVRYRSTPYPKMR